MERKKNITPNESLNGDSSGSEESIETDEENAETTISPPATIPTAATGSILKSMLLGISPTKISIQVPDVEEPKVVKVAKVDVVNVVNVAKLKRPPTKVLVDEALNYLNDRSGSSLIAIKKYIVANYGTIDPLRSTQIKKYIKASVSNGKYTQTKGIGAAGSFKISTQKVKEIQTASKRKEKEKKTAKKEKEKEEAKLSKKSSKGVPAEPKEKKRKASKRTNDKEQEEAVPLKKPKPAKNGDGNKKASKGAKEKNGQQVAENSTNDKTEKAKSKKKVARKSINLLVKTPGGSGGSKSAKKAGKTATASGKKKLTSAQEAVPPAAVKKSGKAKRK